MHFFGLYLSLTLIKLPLTWADFVATSCCNAFFIKPILSVAHCSFDVVFNWSVLANAPKNIFQRKVLEAYYIVLEKPTLNEQLEPERINLF